MKPKVLLMVIAAALPLPAVATTRLFLGFEELVGNSELIFTGTVRDVVVAAEGEAVYSTVTFEIDEVVAGEHAADTVELRFLGGTDGELETEVSGQFIPAVGARGLWFVDALDRSLINPLTGWSQGYFPFAESTDASVWLNLEGHPDYGLLQPLDPLAQKMRDMNFSAAEIAARFPQQSLYSLEDFVAAIEAVAGE